MSNISNIGGPQGQLPQKGVQDSAKAPGKPAAKADQATEQATQGKAADRAEVSQEGFNALLARAREAFEKTPDIREDLIEKVRSRIQSGYYDRPEVIEDLAGKLTQAFREEE